MTAEFLESRFAFNIAPLAPTITEPATNGQVVNPQDVHMETAPFSDPDAGDTHAASQWEIWTTGPGAQRVWLATPSGTAVEKVHIHMGDGAFENSHAGRSSFLADTDYQLRVRFRDSSGEAATEWSPFTARPFQTGDLSQVFPMELEDIIAAPAPTWQTTGGANVILPGGANPPQMLIESHDGALVLRYRGLDGVSNTVTNSLPLTHHAEIRVRVNASPTAPLVLSETNLTFTDDDGNVRTIYLPAITLSAGGQSVYWVSLNGSTYLGNAAQSEPDFGTLVRGAPVPWSAAAGYKVEVVATGFQLPVNLAFVPNAGTDPDDPYYYVTELYGTIKVVRRNGTVSDYATNLLNFNPTGNFPGSGEQGLSGIAVDPITGDVFAAMVYSSTPGVENVPHYPKVVRFHSTDGGLTAATQTTIRDMVGEQQGQSHQISNVTIGLDGKLYVHNGDGFDASTAQNLNSYRGKILRMNLDGTAPTDNPFYNAGNGITATDYVYAYGFRNAFGGAWRQADGKHYSVENGPSVDRFAQVNPSVNYGWNGSDASMAINALYNWNPATAPVNIAFVQSGAFGGSGFGADKQGHAFVTQSGGTWATGPQGNAKNITEFVLDANGNRLSGPTPLVSYNGSGKATAAGLAAGPDGLYFTDLYKDLNYTSPIDRGANVLRVRFVGTSDFNADVRVGDAPLTVNFTDASSVPGASAWSWDFGDGGTSSLQNPSHTFTADGVYTVRLSVTGTGGTVTSTKVGYVRVGNVAEAGLTAIYYDNIDFTGASISRVDATVDFDWGGGSPDPAIGADTFSARWTGQVEPQFNETYTFYTVSDDGVRLYVNGQLLIDNFTDHAPTENSGAITLAAGQRYDITMEMYENGGGAVARLLWSSASTAKAVIPQVRLFSFETLPEAPHDLAAAADSETAITLTWHDHANNEDGFRIERSINGIDFTQIATVGTNVEQYSDTGLSLGTTYYYRLRAYNDSGNSAYSKVAVATTPGGFSSTEVATGLTSPVTLDIAYDGRVFVAFQDGTIRVMENDQMLPTPFATLAADGSGERGLQGIELDPDFETNGYIYVYYTALNPSSHNRVSRLRSDPTNPNVMLAGSETVLLDLPLFSSLPNNTNPIWHMGGAIHVAPDGTLRIQTGDHLNSSLAQVRDSMIGKVLRINRDGSLPTNNPFYNAANGITAQDYVWALGLRNPFSGDIDPVTGQYFIGDVGAGAWEEINDATAPGHNFGWPDTEGPFDQSTHSDFTQPTLAYDHLEDYAITGGVFYHPAVNQFPAEYTGKYFYSQFGAGVIKYIDPANPTSPGTFIIDESFPMNLEVSPDGSLYYIARGAGAGGAPGNGTGKVVKVQYVTNAPPTVFDHPDDTLVSVGYDATFSVSVQGSAPLNYQWQRKDAGAPGFTNITGATSATYTLSNAPLAASGAQFRVVVTNPFGTATSNAATLTVTTNLPPVATITSPANGTLYRGGDIITFAGNGFDNETGNLSASALNWSVDFHHDTHAHPFMAATTGISSGQFTIPVVSETDPDVFYRIHLRATDSIGLVHETFVDVIPRKATYTLATNVPGLTLTLDGQPQTTPHTFEGVVNLQRSLGAPALQSFGGLTYQFVGWSDGGAANHAIFTPDLNTTFTATYQVAPYIYLSDLPFVGTPVNGWGPVERDRSNGEDAAGDGNTISIRGQTYSKGLGAHAASEMIFNLQGGYLRFLTDVGIDDETNGNGSVVFQVFADGVLRYDSGTTLGTSPIKSVDLDVIGVQQLRLVVTDAGNGVGYDHADWAGARLTAVLPNAPVVTATALAANQISLVWPDNSSNEIGFRVERSLTGTGSWTTAATLAAGTTAFIDMGLTPLTRYYYRVFATGVLGDSLSSNVVNATTSDVIRVNFQADAAPTHPGYFRDVGFVFANRGNGYSYGWNEDITAHSRYRQAANSPDLRYDTLNHMQKPANPNAIWEIVVPNGQYSVHVVSGDPSNFDGYFAMNVEGVLTINGAPTSQVRWLEGTSTVTVSDGRLTLSSAAAAQNNKITFVDIDPVPTVDVVDVSPDPRGTPVDAVTINFSESVTGFNLADLTLRRNGGANLLSGAQSLSTTDGKSYLLSGLAGVTATPGTYTLTLTAAGSGIIDNFGAALSASAVDTFVSAVPGDTNLDGDVDFDDAFTLTNSYGIQTGATWGQGDFDGDGDVDFDDAFVQINNYGTGSPVGATGAMSSSFETSDGISAESGAVAAASTAAPPIQTGTLRNLKAPGGKRSAHGGSASGTSRLNFAAVARAIQLASADLDELADVLAHDIIKRTRRTR